MKKSSLFKKPSFYKLILPLLFVGSFIFYEFVQAGNITAPSGSPEAKFFTISDIYNRLTTNTVATEGDHSFAFADPLASTGYTLTQIYNAIPTINPAKLLDDTTYLGVTGTIPTRTLSADSTVVGEGYYGATTLNSIDTDLDATNIKQNTTIFGVSGSLIPSGGDALVANVLSGKTFFGDSQNDWILQTGTMSDNGVFSLTPGGSDQSVNEGYYSGGTLIGDADLIASNIKSGINIFGIDGTMSSGYTYGDNQASYVLGTASSPGTALYNEYNGSASSGDYPQSVGGVDDYNNGSATPGDSYVNSWTTCDASNNYCGTGDLNANKRDNNTGLVWSNWMDSGATKSWFYANNCKYPNSLTGDDGVCDTHNEIACKCVKLTGIGEGGNGAKTGCESLGDGGWRLPYQKELMQSYVDGSRSALSYSTYSYWSATTVSNYTNNAWLVYTYYGYTGYSTKTTSGNYRVRCVR